METKVFLIFCNVQVLITQDGTPDHHGIFSLFSLDPIVLKIQELRQVFAILLEILFDVSWPQQFETLFALGRMWAVEE